MNPSPISSLPHGSLVAILTPFGASGGIDWPALERLIDWHVRSGTRGLVVAGTTGESSTLSMDEHAELLARSVEHAAGRIHIMAGVGANSTAEAVHLARMAQQAGAHSLLSVVPYYNKPTQEGLYRHFSEQADATPLPLVLYSVSGRTVVDFSVSTVRRLAQHPNIRGIKDASGDLVRAQQLSAALPESFVRYSGDDLTGAAVLALGAHGIISVTANVVPAAVQAQCSAIAGGRLAQSRTLVADLFELSQALFTESNPIPVKYLASLMGLCENRLRAPLVPAGTACAHGLEDFFTQSALIADAREAFSDARARAVA
ncbi:4-hydroxy-tetrahydrodipicolinate synthase [Hydrogenophaga laconesensis]|uniref:4-hydroxy-tetrahydrodipicolinate synthase n=1 Tax=Hydrogenophaga laconesensis TaxID=1805971 RepID=A0ABU1VCP9_9BURK|nr:4-hydroxy-tetrahydrodipicolinate synthase [Hydrogenophaga laconesensis]MDR7095105.1 4-hydroxy-tetrahydrodipicolinate synthase [Hydrogenophaga laconesensis]